jgi:hypothetical protein
MYNLDKINRIRWISFFGRSPDESAQTPIAFGEDFFEIVANKAQS